MFLCTDVAFFPLSLIVAGGHQISLPTWPAPPQGTEPLVQVSPLSGGGEPGTTGLTH